MPAPTTVVRLEVHTDPEGDLLVEWALEGVPVAVDVATGTSPDTIDHRHHATVPAGTTVTTIPASGASRPFVSVSPHGQGPALVGADRRVVFEGITNFRDLGGYRTSDGGTVRWGQVFRSDALHGLSPQDLDRYHQLGIRSVFDLRSDAERASRPNPVPTVGFTLESRASDGPAAPPTDDAGPNGERFLLNVYLALLEHGASRIGELFTAMAQAAALPAVLHCHAGKDRTGVAAALLLEVLGVPREVVLDDYELTSRYRLREQQESSFRNLLDLGLTPEAAAGVLTTPRSAMAEALATIEATHGGIEAYLSGPAGMSGAALAALRERLVVPAQPASAPD